MDEIIDLNQQDQTIHFLSSNPNNNNTQLNSHSKLHKIQNDLLKMGFDIDMINKIIEHYIIASTEEALYYLLKTDGLWNHKFIPLKEVKEQELSNMIVSSAISTVRAKTNQEQCDICKEVKGAHRLILEDNNELRNIRDDVLQINQQHQESINDNNEEEEEEDDQCGICMGDYENPIDIQPCLHQFCLECFTSYLTEKINTNNVEMIPCPKIQCDNNQLDQDFIFKYINDDLILKYHAFKKKNAISKDPYKIFCPSCDNYSELPPVNDLTKQLLSCANGHTFCSCGRLEHEGPCYKEDDSYNKFIAKEKIKKCPKCGFLIKKNRGCNHMICGNPMCKYEFCWLCLQESLPNHYTIGDCEGFQFIDEEGWLYQMRRYPITFKILSFLYEILMCILTVIFLEICLLFPIPVIPILTYFDYVSEAESYWINEGVNTTHPKLIGVMYWISLNIILVPVYPLYYFGFIMAHAMFVLAVCLRTLIFLCSCCGYVECEDCLCCCCDCCFNDDDFTIINRQEEAGNDQQFPNNNNLQDNLIGIESDNE